VAAQTGLDVKKALADAQTPEIEAVLKQDVEDLTALEVTKTPTFFVNAGDCPASAPISLPHWLLKKSPRTRNNLAAFLGHRASVLVAPAHSGWKILLEELV